VSALEENDLPVQHCCYSLRCRRPRPHRNQGRRHFAVLLEVLALGPQSLVLGLPSGQAWVGEGGLPSARAHAWV
jgi:hypothetical protein